MIFSLNSTKKPTTSIELKDPPGHKPKIMNLDSDKQESNFVSLLHAIAMEIHALVACSLLLPFTGLDSHLRSSGGNDGTPILMLNGYASFGSTWAYQKKNLIKANLGPIYTMNVRSFTSIQSNAEDVQKQVAQIEQETGCTKLIIIGHSKGGLVGAYYATALSQNNKSMITKVITIGSPLKGTYLAHFGPGTDAIEMKPGSVFLTDLESRIKQAIRTQFYHIGSEMDIVVPPSSALRGDHPDRELHVNHVGHTGLLFDPMIAKQVTKWAKEPEASA
ncbi:MAG: alpha/beta hydrolase [Chlamydiia bacterium]